MLSSRGRTILLAAAPAPGCALLPGTAARRSSPSRTASCTEPRSQNSSTSSTCIAAAWRQCQAVLLQLRRRPAATASWQHAHASAGSQATPHASDEAQAIAHLHPASARAPSLSLAEHAAEAAAIAAAAVDGSADALRMLLLLHSVAVNAAGIVLRAARQEAAARQQLRSGSAALARAAQQLRVHTGTHACWQRESCAASDARVHAPNGGCGSRGSARRCRAAASG